MVGSKQAAADLVPEVAEPRLPKLKRLQGITPELQLELRECFKMMDTDSSGSIDIQELREAMGMLGITLGVSLGPPCTAESNSREHHMPSELSCAPRLHECHCPPHWRVGLT